MMTPQLAYHLSWAKEQTGDAEGATWGDLRISLGDTPLWAGAAESAGGGVRWTWISLLEHLAEVWPWLVLEEGWPAGPVVRDPGAFWSESRRWLEGLPERDAAHQDEALYEFRHRHDLALAVRGKLLPPLWIVREGRQAWVASEGVHALLPFDEVRSWLAALAGDIRARLAVMHDERAAAAIDAWDGRMDRDPHELAAVCVGVDAADLAVLAGGDVLGAFEIDPKRAREAFEPNELLAAARMSLPCTSAAIVRVIMDAMRVIPRAPTPVLDRLAGGAQTVLAGLGDAAKPAVLGQQLATHLRRALGCADDLAVDPEALLTDWRVQVRDFDAPDEGIEAVACWGPTHGPAILVNKSGRHSTDPAGRRATLAHEIAHLLVDRGGALPLAEVFGGQVSRPVEQRAGAFAAELLVPRQVAGAAFRDTTEPRAALEQLCTRYHASREVVAWQAYNSGAGMTWDTFSLLRNQVTYPERYQWHVVSRP